MFIFCVFFFFKQKTAYDMRISDWSSDVCSSDLVKVLSGARVSQFTLHRNDGRYEKYVNGKSFELNNEPIGGFLHVLDSGKWILLVKKDLKEIGRASCRERVCQYV